MAGREGVLGPPGAAYRSRVVRGIEYLMNNMRCWVLEQLGHGAHDLICSPQTTRAQRAEREEGGNSQKQGNNFRPHLNPHSEGSLVLIAQLHHALGTKAEPHERHARCIHLLDRKNARLRCVDYFSSCSDKWSYTRARGS